MDEQKTITFEQPDLLACLEALDNGGLDTLEFGVIGFDADTVVCRYNAYESREAHLPPEKVIGLPVFAAVAQCMNNYLVAQRFEDAQAAGSSLDATIDYVLTWRMRPTKVKLRMLSVPEYATRYVLLLRVP